MSAIYLHVPFCKSACNYCNFHFATSLHKKSDMICAMIKEIGLQKNFFNQATTIKTIYFGGGTPSILSPKDLEGLLQEVYKIFSVNADVEITLEINPDDVCEEKLKAWLGLGFNRFSLGVQSFFDDDLHYLNRVHNAHQALRSLELLTKFAVYNFSTDIIFGIPTGSIKKTEENLQKLLDFNVPHISCYSLTVEPKTPLHKLIKNKKIANVDIAHQADLFDCVMGFFSRHGYEQYEISNYALPGFRSKHNSNYWGNESYLGLGPSAHSYNGESRQWNVANNAIYIKAITNNTLPFEEEVLTIKNKYNEFIMMNLRKSEGISGIVLKDKFGEFFMTHFLQHLSSINPAHYIWQVGYLKLTRAGKMFCDGISAGLFI